MKLKKYSNSYSFGNLFRYTVPILFLFLSGCLGIERVSCKEMEIAKWHFDHGEYKEALPIIEKFAKNDDPHAQYMLGYMYFYGNGVKIDRLKAEHYFNESAERGYSPALMAQHIIKDTQKKQHVSITTPTIVTQSNDLDNASKFSKIPISVKKTDIVSIQGTSSEENDVLDEKKINSISNKLYTIQMLALADLSEMRKVINKYELYDGYYLYRTVRNNKPWYVLIGGYYKKISDAHTAIEQLPKVMKRWKPFINKFKVVHKQINTNREII
ncbi:MAG: SEL1-like repeat protein [Legionellales bacterium]|nr:SEL1-like repeat protein [Legionellales bacterium]